MKKIRYGILSAAQIVPRFVQGVQQSQQGEVTAIASRTTGKAQTMAKELNISKVFDSYEGLCQSSDVDIVYIPVYNRGHFEAAKLALSHRKHVLLEKPFTLKTSEAKELFRLAQNNQVFLMEAQKSVFLPLTQKVKKALQADAIGKIKWLQSITTYPSVDHIKWFYSLAAGGGVLHGAGSYPLQYIQYLLDLPVQNYQGLAVANPGETDSQCTLSLQFDRGILGNIFLGVNLEIPSRLTIHGTKGKIDIPTFWRGKEALITYTDGTREKISADFDSEFVFEVDHVNDCLNKGRLTSPIMTEKLTVDTVALVENLYSQWLPEN
ncbi:Gfo/Idh/MocA family protein [Vagococcus elongatus]|uniref:Oxidoreductase n=1 Tax=Vagococcus elongatus TaxID=180344 RepID=A0A430ALI5_9ENTE|nr:Gfo/Idh/MocA family oxidoreductase [Vagococcus elongatus]RSU08844.1 oxidoreductase [Vagococcus elongatus]